MKKRTVIGPTKCKKIQSVDFCDTLAEILNAAKQEQMQNRKNYGELYCQSYNVWVKEKNGAYHELYTLSVNADVPKSHNVVLLVCV